MKTSLLIRKSVAFLLLLVFITGTAPKAYFHDLIAHHTDVHACSIKHDSVVFHQQEIDCDFDNLVVPIPFLLQGSITISSEIRYNQSEPLFYSQSYYPSYYSVKENRGPPEA